MIARRRSFATPIFIALFVLICTVAGGMWHSGRAGWLEAVSFITGAVCVWLTVRENVWNFPIGLLNVITFSIVFFHAGLFADAGLQVVYFALGCIGWYLWLFGGERRTALHVNKALARELMVMGLFAIVAKLGLWRT